MSVLPLSSISARVQASPTHRRSTTEPDTCPRHREPETGPKDALGNRLAQENESQDPHDGATRSLEDSSNALSEAKGAANE